MPPPDDLDGFRGIGLAIVLGLLLFGAAIMWIAACRGVPA